MVRYNSNRQLNRIQRQWRVFVGAAVVAALLGIAELSDITPSSPNPSPLRGEGRNNPNLCPRPFGREGVRQPTDR
ncbi:exported hypothetical protein [Acidobacteriia bacterium SbA2]|nr:exported hypothetical protein [Acidobacteriia bacterium SbA2]